MLRTKTLSTRLRAALRLHPDVEEEERDEMANENECQGSRDTAQNISRDTNINIGLAICIGVFLVSIVTGYVNIKRDIEQHAKIIGGFEGAVAEVRVATRAISSIQRDVSENQRQLRTAHGHWRRFSMDQWTRRLRQDNPDFDVPDAMKTPWFDSEKGVIVYP